MRRATRLFSTTRATQDAATCQLLGKFGSTPTTFKTRDGKPAVRYLFAVNRGPPVESQQSSSSSNTTSWFNVVSFDERAIERLTQEDLKGAKALVNATFDVRRQRDEGTGQYSDTVSIRQTGLHIIERRKKTTTDNVPDEAAQSSALEDSFTA